jgi:glycosyltransferase involved in cell wall biosynthesis
VLAFDSHASGSEGRRAALRRAYLRVLDRRVRTWLPAGSPQARHLAAAIAPRAPLVRERMTTDTDALEAERARLGPGGGAAWRRAHGVPDDAALVLYVGRIAPEKGVSDLLRAAGLLAIGGRRFRVALLGGGTLPPEAHHVAIQGLVVAPGRVAWRSLVAAYLAADVFVLPSRREPWGLVVNEALLLGCPVVVTDAVGAAADLVAGPGSGVVVRAGDPPALAAGIARVLDAGGRRSPYAANAARAMRGWTLADAARRLRGVLAGRGSRAEA